MRRQWSEQGIGVPLRVLASPYRDLSGPVMEELGRIAAEHPEDVITVVLPEFVLTTWWEHLLHNQSALLLKARLLFRRNTVVVSVPYRIDRSVDEVGEEAVVAPRVTTG